MPIDAYRRGDTFVIKFDLPGVDPSSIDLTVEKNMLTVKAERQTDLSDGEEVLISERPKGTFSREIFLGDGLDVDKIDAHYDTGVLTVTIPVSDAVKPRHIEISGGHNGDRTLTTNAS